MNVICIVKDNCWNLTFITVNNFHYGKRFKADELYECQFKIKTSQLRSGSGLFDITINN